MKKIGTISYYIIAVLLLMIYLMFELIPNIEKLSEIARIFLLCGSCFFLYLGGLLLSKERKDNKPMKINLWIFFALYLILFITLTLFDSMWLRNGLNFINWFSDEFVYYIKNSVNFIPFKTIISFAKEFNSMYGNREVLLNLFGNFIALMPMAFFLLLLFKKQNKFKNFFLTIILIVFTIESLQLLTASGRFDIDDFILNISGATLMYFVLKIKDVNKLIKNIFLGEKNKIPKKNLIIIIISTLMVILSFVMLVKFRNKLYNDNFIEYEKIHNPDTEIVDESGNNCASELDLFYEDEEFEYYFPCLKSDKVYVIVNSGEKYLVKDFIGEKTKYNYDINRMLKRLDFFKVSYIKKEKYKSISIKVKLIKEGDLATEPKRNVIIQNKDILDFKYGSNNSYIDDEFYSFKVYLIPKKEGTTVVNITSSDYEGHLLESYKYSVTVDNKLNVEFTKIE